MSLDKDLKKYETLLVINELSEIIKNHTTALSRVDLLAEEYEGIITPNEIDALRNHLRDNQNILLREFNGLQQGGRTKKVYDKRYVCTKCHSVFLMPLTNGMCDQCRSKGEPAPYPKLNPSVNKRDEED
jgi:hypothetical protein